LTDENSGSTLLSSSLYEKLNHLEPFAQTMKLAAFLAGEGFGDAANPCCRQIHGKSKYNQMA
jgi:hypothetical protein